MANLFMNVTCVPVRQWLQAAVAETGAQGYSRVGSMEEFFLEPRAVNVYP